MMDQIQSPITTIPGIGVRMGAMILAEIGDFSRFDSPDKILAYAGMSPSTYQSGKLSLSGAYSHMEKRGSKFGPLRKFCVSVFRQNQEYHVFKVHGEGLFPLSTALPAGCGGMRAGTA